LSARRGFNEERGEASKLGRAFEADGLWLGSQPGTAFAYGTSLDWMSLVVEKVSGWVIAGSALAAADLGEGEYCPQTGRCSAGNNPRALVVEKVSGMPLEDYFQQNIFRFVDSILLLPGRRERGAVRERGTGLAAKS
jgi:hypothetical protein